MDERDAIIEEAWRERARERGMDPDTFRPSVISWDLARRALAAERRRVTREVEALKQWNHGCDDFRCLARPDVLGVVGRGVPEQEEK